MLLLTGSHATVSPAWVSTTESPIKNSDSYTGTGSKSCENTSRTGFWQKTSPESALPEPGTFGRFFRISGNPDTILSFISTKRKTTESLYKAEDYGIPQTRHRVIIVGIRNDLDVTFQVPDPDPYFRDNTAGTALSYIPEWAANQELKHLSDPVLRRLSLIRPGENLWQAMERMGDAFPEELKIHTRTRISQCYRKLDPSRPAYTVTASGGGGSFMYHWFDRELSNRERARLQTFPDDFRFTGNYASVRKQIGMAVPCRLSNILVTAVLNCLAGIEYPYVPANIM